MGRQKYPACYCLEGCGTNLAKMKNHTVTPMDTPVGFELRDENGNLIAFCLDESTANVFAHVPAQNFKSGSFGKLGYQ